MNLSSRDLAPNEKGQIKVTLHTRGRRDKVQKSITVESNDPDHPTIKLTIMAAVKAEFSIAPMTVYFRNMKRGEQRYEKVQVKNTSGKTLEILSIETGGGEMATVDLINRSPDWPIELKSNEALELLVSFRYQIDNPRFSKQVTIKYTGGQATDAYFRIYAMLKQTKKAVLPPNLPRPADLKNLKDNKKQGIKTLPSNNNANTKSEAQDQNSPGLKPKGEKID